MSFIDQEKLSALNDKVYERGHVDREHIMELLSLIKTNDAQSIIDIVKKWLIARHEDPKFDKVVFPEGDINAILSDLDSYGRVSAQNLAEFKGQSNKSLPIS